MTNDDPVLSIIVPVYNVKDYVNDCVCSFYNSCDIKKIQVIIVDDGSTDGAAEICDKLAKKKNIEVWHKRNGGLASARNYGLRKARGRYVSFVDSDDKIDGASFGEVLEFLESGEADVYFMNITKFYLDGNVKDMGENIEGDILARSDKEETLKYLSTRNKFPASACGKIYKLDFLLKNKIKFPDDNIVSEDLGFAFDVIRLASSYGKIESPYYLYRQERKGSITNSVSSKSFDGVALFVTKYSEEKDKYLLSFVAYEYAILLWLYAFVEKRKRESARKILDKYRSVLKYGNTRRLKIVRCMVSVFGVCLTSKVLYMMKRRRE